MDEWFNKEFEGIEHFTSDCLRQEVRLRTVRCCFSRTTCAVSMRPLDPQGCAISYPYLISIRPKHPENYQKQPSNNDRTICGSFMLEANMLLRRDNHILKSRTQLCLLVRVHPFTTGNTLLCYCLLMTFQYMRQAILTQFMTMCNEVILVRSAI